MRTGTIATPKTFPMKEGDTLVFRNKYGRVTSVHRVTFVNDTSNTKENISFTEVRDAT